MKSSDLDFKTSPAFFEAKYQETKDPWNFAADPYELSRYDAIIHAISHRRYRRAFEPGCSIGVLTERLAAHCEEVDAVDFSPSAAALAKARCAHLPNVNVRCEAFEPGLIAPDVDLLVLSEIGYYFEADKWEEMCAAMVRTIAPGVTVVAAHWLGYSEDHRISGNTVHEVLLSHPQLQPQRAEQNQSMRLDMLVRR